MTLHSYQPATPKCRLKLTFARQVELSINTSKTQVMCVNSTPTRTILGNEEPLEFVEEFTYLDSLISKDRGVS